MPQLFTPQPSEPLPQRGVLWVCQLAFVVFFFACWFVVLFQVAMIIKAELRLARVLAEVNEFAKLPETRQHEVKAFVSKRLDRSGYDGGKITTRRAADGTWQVMAVEVAPHSTMPRWLQAFPQLKSSPILAGEVPTAEPRHWFIAE